MRSYLTYQQLDTLTRFADDEKSPIDMEAVEALNILAYTVQRNIAKLLTGAQKRNRMLQERLDKFRERNEEKAIAGEFTTRQVDSAVAARALLYQLQQLKTWKLSRAKVIAILFEMYASWLYGKKERIFDEEPVATEYGPQFWHAWKSINVSDPVSFDEWAAFAKENTDIAAYMKNAARAYYDKTESTLNKIFKATIAYKNAMPEKNGGKWNKVIEDRDIYAWKKKDDEKRRQHSATD